VDAIGRNDVVGEPRATGTINCAGERIEERRVGIGAEVPGALILRGNREGVLFGDALERPFIPAEEEELVLLYRPANRGIARRYDKLKGLSKLMLRKRSMILFVELLSVMVQGKEPSFQSSDELSILMRPV
jgi:hypothetical protein